MVEDKGFFYNIYNKVVSQPIKLHLKICNQINNMAEGSNALCTKYCIAQNSIFRQTGSQRVSMHYFYTFDSLIFKKYVLH